jgi:hypothetical protein
MVGTLLLAFAQTARVEAQEQNPSGEADKETYIHVVVKGDTLWDICDALYSNPWVWPKVWELNQHITNPHWIYPGTELRVYYELPESLKALSSVPVEEVTPAVEPSTQLPSQAALPPPPPPPPPPKAPAMTFAEIDQVGFITPFIPQGVGMIVGEERQRKLIGAPDKIYLKFSKRAEPEVGKRYFIFSTSELFRHPVTQKDVGYLNTILGVVEVTEVASGYAKARVRSSYQSISPGDKLMPYKKRSEEIALQDGTEPIEGNIILSKGETFLIGDMQIVYIDLGQRDDIKAGHRFMVFRTPKAEEVFTGKEAKLVLSVEPIGELMVLSVEYETAAAVVTYSLNEFMPGERIRLVTQN